MLFPVTAEDRDASGLRQALRVAEALLFAAAEPLDEAQIAERLPAGSAVSEVLAALRADYANRGVALVRVGKKWMFRTADDLGWLLSRQTEERRKLSKPALETLAIIAYHQPVTRAEIEDIRGVAISKGTLDMLLETGWVRLRGRRKAPGRPVTYGTTDAFLMHFGLEQIADLPGLDDLKGAGLFDGRLPPGFGVPSPRDDSALGEDEDPLEDSGETEPLDAGDSRQDLEDALEAPLAATALEEIDAPEDSGEAAESGPSESGPSENDPETSADGNHAPDPRHAPEDEDW